MGSAFKKVSRVGHLTGATKWYLSKDCLLAAKRMMYSVEYRRFYLCDLESIVVWPSHTWLLRPIIPAVVLGAFGALLWYSVNFVTGAITGGTGLAWAALELALGPIAKSRIRTSGATVDLPLVKRARRAHKLLARIDVAVAAARRTATEHTGTGTDGPRGTNPPTEPGSKAAPAVASIGDLA